MNGRGNQGAYFSEIDEDLLDLVLEKSFSNLEIIFSCKSNNFEAINIGEEIDQAFESKIIKSQSISETDKIQLIKARRGQGLFRENVQQSECACRVTGVESKFLLIASHIMPWRSCSNSEERLDGNNGLLLIPHVYRLFDRGYITFGNGGDLVFFSNLNTENIYRLGISNQKFAAIPFGTEKNRYLDFHRKNVFLR
jgi:putative restriction endonuclease